MLFVGTVGGLTRIRPKNYSYQEARGPVRAAEISRNEGLLSSFYQVIRDISASFHGVSSK